MDDEIKIEGIERIIPDIQTIHPITGKKKRDRKPRDEAGKHFQELAGKAEQVHRILAEKKSPYRFCVYQVGEEVFIDIAIVDQNSKVQEVYKRNITRDEFQSWLQLIESESGMIFDREV